jgi:uncharacterized protein YjiS (DUF1127 family)
MSLLAYNSNYSWAFGARKWAAGICGRLFAAFITLRHRNAASAALSRLSDRELSDIGLYRGQIGTAMEDIAQYRASKQIPTL